MCGLQHINELNDVSVVTHLLEQKDFPEEPFAVTHIAENTPNLLDGQMIPRGQMLSFHHCAIAALTK